VRDVGGAFRLHLRPPPLHVGGVAAAAATARAAAAGGAAAAAAAAAAAVGATGLAGADAHRALTGHGDRLTLCPRAPGPEGCPPRGPPRNPRAPVARRRAMRHKAAAASASNRLVEILTSNRAHSQANHRTARTHTQLKQTIQNLTLKLVRK